MKQLWVHIPTYSDKPPYHKVGMSGTCVQCGSGPFNPIPDECPDCKAPPKAGHPLEAAFARHKRNACQPITTKWVDWVIAPYQVAMGVHPRYAEWRRSGTTQTFKDWLGIKPEPINKTDPDYQLSESGLSYEQWLDTPPELEHHLKQDWKVFGDGSFSDWLTQRRSNK